ncbi:MAG: fumarylacetoacetase [Rubrivivax sp.]|nr:fumarylacetoacetase [Rubrivivax sp.]
MRGPDSTHDPSLRSWVESANEAGTDFPIQNLPFGRFRTHGSEPWRIGVAIGDQVLDLKLAAELCPWPSRVSVWLEPLAAGDLNAFMALGARPRRALRAALSAALAEHSDQGPFLELCLVPQAQAQMALPCTIGDYTDFFAGVHHATTVGKLFRPDTPLLPNYHWVPIGYHGRASSLRVSGGPVRRPNGQYKLPEQEVPVFGPSRRLDYELELGILVGVGNELGEPKTMAQAEEDWFGLVLMNDWSARDVQAWEYQPLGPFLAKSFATTLSPWVVTREALEPFRVPFARDAALPQPLPYLDSQDNREGGHVDMHLEVLLQSTAMRDRGQDPVRLSHSNFKDAHWTIAQLLAHHTVNGCNLQPGDLLGTGTLSGARPEQGGSLLELSAGGWQPLILPGGETRSFLLDGDRVILRGWCERKGARRIGLGSCVGTVEGAIPWPPTGGV